MSTRFRRPEVVPAATIDSELPPGGSRDASPGSRARAAQAPPVRRPAATARRAAVRRIPAFAVTAAAVMTGVVVAFSGGGASHRTSAQLGASHGTVPGPRRLASLPRPSPIPPVKGYSAAELAAFPVFARRPSAADSLPGALAARVKPFAAQTGMNLRLARRILVDRAGAMYLAPGGGSVCMVTAIPAGFPTGSECAMSSRAVSHGFFELQGQAGEFTVTGVVPGFARAITFRSQQGAPTTVRVSAGGGYRATLPGVPVSESLVGRARAVNISIGSSSGNQPSPPRASH
jgi:hypothetical protein